MALHTRLTFPRARLTFPVRVLSTPSELRSGLMFSPHVIESLFFIFPESGRLRNAIHSFFCPPFDAVFLDSKKRVVDIRRLLPPFHPLIVPAKASKYLLEAPAGSCFRLRVGDSAKLKQV